MGALGAVGEACPTAPFHLKCHAKNPHPSPEGEGEKVHDILSETHHYVTALLRLVLLDWVGFSPFLVFFEGGLAGFDFRETGVLKAAE